MRRALALGAVVWTSFAQPGAARAQDAVPSPPPEAKPDFADRVSAVLGVARERVTEAIDKGRIAQICPLLMVAAQKPPRSFDAQLGTAECAERIGLFASASRYYAAAAGVAGAGEEQRNAASAKVAELEPKLAKVRLVVPPELAALPGLVIRFDHAVVPAAAREAPEPVDAGEHVVEVAADERLPFRRTLRVKDGELLPVKLPSSLADPPGQTVWVRSNFAGAAAIDGRVQGQVTPDAPLKVARVPPGPQEVSVEGDWGGDSRRVAIGDAGVVKVTFAPPFSYRRGWHGGFSLGALAPVIPTGGIGYVSGGALVDGFANFAAAPYFDFRPGLRIGGAGSVTGFALGNVTGYLQARFNIGTIYTLQLGFDVGGEILKRGDDVCLGSCGTTTYSPNPHLAFGPEWSVLTFNFGAKRDWFFEYVQGVRLAKLSSAYSYVDPLGTGGTVSSITTTLTSVYWQTLTLGHVFL